MEKSHEERVPDYVPDEWVARYGTTNPPHGDQVHPRRLAVGRHRGLPARVGLAGCIAVPAAVLVALTVLAPAPYVAGAALLVALLFAGGAALLFAHALLRTGKPHGRR